MKIKLFIFASLGLVSLPFLGQHSDSLQHVNVLSEVVVSAFPRDASTKDEWQTIAPLHLGQFLQNNGYGQIQSYGPDGTMSSLRFRGLASDYTTVYWNDIPLNAITHGGTDLSLIPLFFLDEVESDRMRMHSTNQWNNISSGLFLRSGQMDDQIRNRLRLIQSYSGMRNSATGLELAWNRKTNALQTRPNQKYWNWGGTSRVFYQHLRNEFDYVDQFRLDRPVVQQHHNNGINRGLLQTLFATQGRHRMELDMWLQDRTMALPLQMGQSGHSTQEQDDAIRRMNIRYVHNRGHWMYKMALAHNQERMVFRDHMQPDGRWLLDSRLTAITHLFNNTVLWVPNQRWSFGFSALGVNNTVENSNYPGGRKAMQWLQLAGDARWRYGPFTFSAGGRHEFRDIATKMNAHAAMLWKGRSHRGRLDWVTQAQVARRFRSPDVNDLYWSPGGNPGLRPEEGATAELFLNLNGHFGDHWRWTLQSNFYYTEMTDMIVWLPYNQAYWSPVNMQRVYSKGVDGLMKWSFHSKIVKWDNTYRMQLNQSTSEGKVLPYMPQAIHALQTNLRWGKWNAGGSAVYTSQRFTDAQNKTIWSLDPYWLFGAELARQYEWSRHTVLVVASVNNVLNTPYQSVRGYAMPGRYFQIQISYQIKQYHDVKNVEAELLRDVGGH